MATIVANHSTHKQAKYNFDERIRSNTAANVLSASLLDDHKDLHTSNKIQLRTRKLCQVGYNEHGALMPGFEDVTDDQMAFSSESDFAIFIKQISSEIPLQRLVAVKRMIKSCTLWGEEAVLSVLPRVKQLSIDKEMVIRQAIAEVLGPFAKYLVESMQYIVYSDDSSVNSLTGLQRAHQVIISELLPLIKEMLKDAMEVRQGAGHSLVIIAELLNKEQVYEHILKIVLHMAHDDSDDQKITALPLLGDLAPIVGAAVCKNYLSADLHALSQDNSFRVRKATVQYFGPICEQLGNEDAESCLLPIFLSLCNDSIWSVRKGCVESFVDISNSISQPKRIELIPMMEKFLNDSSRWVRNTAYEVLGPFISSLGPDGSVITVDFLKYFTSIPHLSSAEADADCTNHCAFNFPSVALIIGKNRWSQELNDCYNILCRKTFKSRKTLSCSVHEVARILGTELTEKYLLNSIEFFLKDIDDIRQGIIKNLWKTLKVLSMKLRIEYISTLWELASESDINWRFRLLLAKQLDEILLLYNKQILKEQIIPLIFQLCQDRMADVRYSAVYPIADAINILSADEVDLQSVTEKIQIIYHGRTYSKRLLYIRICSSCFNRIPMQLFNTIFLKDLLNYSHDKTFNVRYCLARFIFNNFIKRTEMHDIYLRNNNVVKNAIVVLKNDTEDIEIKRFFMASYEIEMYLNAKRQIMNTKSEAQNKNVNQTYSKCYSDNDDDDDDYDDNNYDDDDDDDDGDDDDNDDELDGSDNLNSIGQELKNIGGNLNVLSATTKTLEPQDTPIRLNVRTDDEDQLQNNVSGTN